MPWGFFMSEKKEMAVAIGKTDASTPAVVGRYVVDPLVMSDGVCMFSWRQYRFANHYRKSLDLDAACADSGMKKDAALRFLQKPDVKAWMGDRMQMQEIKRTWSAEGRWWAEGDRMYRGKDVPKHKLFIWDKFGERLEIKPGQGNAGNKDMVQINISADVISSIRERERSVEAEIVNRQA